VTGDHKSLREENPMRVARALSALVAMGLLGVLPASGDDKPATKAASSPTFDAIKKLAGEWVAVKDGKPTDQVVSVYKVTAGGSAVVETIFPGTDHEMITMYTQEGPDVFLTHYCVLGNQPRLKAEKSTDGNKFVFKCVGGGNLDPAKDSHMGMGVLTIINADEMKSDWTRCENGKNCETHGFHVIRKKKA
jgi:hypothetical protein